nr:hypothetical protein [uncultured bacterium]
MRPGETGRGSARRHFQSVRGVGERPIRTAGEGEVVLA